MMEHRKWCNGDGNIWPAYTMTEEGGILNFNHSVELDQVPFVVYANYECLVPPINKQGASVLH